MYSYVWNENNSVYDLYWDGVLLDSFKTKKGVEMYIKAMTETEK